MARLRIFCLLRRAQKERKSVERVHDFGRILSNGDYGSGLSGTHGSDRRQKSGQHRWLSNRDVVSSEYELELRRELCEAANGVDVVRQICFRPEQPDRRGIVSVAGEEQAVRAV